jgi:hypothetical protein
MLKAADKRARKLLIILKEVVLFFNNTRTPRPMQYLRSGGSGQSRIS